MKFDFIDFKIKPEISEALYAVVLIKESSVQNLWVSLIRSSEIISHYSCPVWFQMIWEKTDPHTTIVLGEEILQNNSLLPRLIDLIYDKTYEILNESLWQIRIKNPRLSSQIIGSFYRRILKTDYGNYAELFECLFSLMKIDKEVFIQEIRDIAMGKSQI